MRTLWVSFTATAICMLFAVPSGYAIARSSPRRRNLLLMLVIVPFWTSFLIRVFAWKSILHPDGIIKKILVFLGLVDANTSLLYHLGAVILVTVYRFLPFAILPIYAAAEKFDYRLIEAARDLGASSWEAARRVLLPMLAPGLAAAGLIAFTLSVDDFVITFFVAGPVATTLPIRVYSMIKHGATPLINALSTLLLALTFTTVLVSQRLSASNALKSRIME